MTAAQAAVTTAGRTVPRTLRELRLARRLSLRQLAEQAQVNHGALSQIERGRIVAQPHELRALERALRLPTGDLEVRVMVIREEPT